MSLLASNCSCRATKICASWLSRLAEPASLSAVWRATGRGVERPGSWLAVVESIEFPLETLHGPHPKCTKLVLRTMHDVCDFGERQEIEITQLDHLAIVERQV